MKTGNNNYEIECSGVGFLRVSLRAVLPGVLVDSAQAGNLLSQRIVIDWLKSNAANGSTLSSYPIGWDNIEFVVEATDV